MSGASLALFADLGACHVQKSSVTICVLPAPFRWRATEVDFIVQHRIGVSIRALRVEGDVHDFAIEHDEQIVISIHALRVEGDPVLLTSILYIYSCIMSSVFSKILKNS